MSEVQHLMKQFNQDHTKSRVLYGDTHIIIIIIVM